MLNTESLLDLTPQKATVVSKIDYNRVKQEWFIREAWKCRICAPLRCW